MEIKVQGELEEYHWSLWRFDILLMDISEGQVLVDTGQKSRELETLSGTVCQTNRPHILYFPQLFQQHIQTSALRNCNCNWHSSKVIVYQLTKASHVDNVAM